MVSLRKISLRLLTAILILNITFSPVAARAVEDDQGYSKVDYGDNSGTGAYGGGTSGSGTSGSGTGATTGAGGGDSQTQMEVLRLQMTITEFQSARAELVTQLADTSNATARADIIKAIREIDQEIQTLRTEITALQNGTATTNYSCSRACDMDKKATMDFLQGKSCGTDKTCESCKMALMGIGGNDTALTGRTGELGHRCLAWDETLSSIDKSKKARNLYRLGAGICGVAAILAGVAMVVPPPARAGWEIAARWGGISCGVAVVGLALFDFFVAKSDVASTNKNIEAAVETAKSRGSNQAEIDQFNSNKKENQGFDALKSSPAFGALTSTATQLVSTTLIAGISSLKTIGQKLVSSMSSMGFIAFTTGSTAFALNRRASDAAQAKRDMEAIKRTTCRDIETVLAASKNSLARTMTCIGIYGVMNKYAPSPTGPGSGPGNGDGPSGPGSGPGEGTSTIGGLGSDGGNGTSGDGLGSGEFNPFAGLNENGTGSITPTSEMAADPETMQRIEQINSTLNDIIKQQPGYAKLLKELGPLVNQELDAGRGLSGAIQRAVPNLGDTGMGIFKEIDAASKSIADDYKKEYGDKTVLTDPSLAALKSGGGKSGSGASSGFGDWGSGGEGGGSMIGDLIFGSGANRGPASEADADHIHLSQNRSIFKIVSDRLAVKAKDKAVVSAQEAKAAAAAALKSKSRSRLPASTKSKSRASGTL